MNELKARILRRCISGLSIILIGLVPASTTRPSEAVLGEQTAAEDLMPQLMPQLGHSAVFSAAVSPDGRYVLTSGLSSSRLWDAQTGRVIRLFRGNNGIFSPDAIYVLTVVSKETRLWEMESGREVRRFDGSHAGFGSVFSPDGRYILTSQDNVALMWEFETGREARRFDKYPAAINAANFSPGGRYVVTAGADKTARLWEAQTGREVRRFEGHSAPLISAVCSPDEKYVLTTSEDVRSVRLWDTETARELRAFQKDRDDYLLIRPATFSPNGRYVLTASWYTAALMWETESGREVRRFPHDGPVYSATFSPDGRHALISGISKATRLVDAQTGQVIRLFQGFSNNISSVAFSPEGKYALLAGGEGDAYLWEVDAGREVRRFKGSSSHIYSASFSPDGRHVLMPGNDTTAHVFETETGREGPRLKGHSEPVYSAAMSPDGKYVLTASGDRTARLWETSTGRQVHKFKAGEGDTDLATEASATFSPDGKYVLADWGWGHKTAQAWDVKSGREVARFKGHEGYIASAVYSPDGKYVLTASYDKTTRMWDAKTGRELRLFQGHTAPVNSIVMSPSGEFVLTASVDKQVLLFKTETATVVRRFEADMGAFLSAVFTRDGKYVLAANAENTVWLWETESGRPQGRFEGHPDNFARDVKTSAALSHDEKYLLTAQEDGTARLWSVAGGRQLCQMMSFQDGTWVVTDAVGRFDTNDLGEIRGLNWVMPDDPLSPLPVEIFMRQYYEPRLLTRILGGEAFAALPPLGSLNRAQPSVTIKGISLQPGSDDRVSVTVEVAQGRRQVRRGGQRLEMLSGVYDLRLFRNGQLVGYTPADGGKVEVSPEEGKAVVVFRGIKLPLTAGARQVEFTAYAFNVDRVKSATDRKIVEIPGGLKLVKGKAYLINIGINLYATSQVRSLLFSANDARRLRDSLAVRLRQSQDYSEVIPVTMIADFEEGHDEAVIPPTKENIKAVFDLLAGKAADPEHLRAIPEQLKLKLRAAEPHDLVFISFSTHGEADDRGNYYLYPSDVEGATSPEFLKRSISSDELSLWLRDIDAGELVMILDTCHSGAAAGVGFKPGPMGSRGLGQLAYDKGMRILAATQADNVALGSGVSAGGLLTTALVRDGLDRGEAAVAGRITMKSWLDYGINRVPVLYAEEVPAEGDVWPQKIQRPTLFDFSRVKRELVLSR